MLVKIRVVLVRNTIIIGIREPEITLLTSICQSNVILLVKTGTEHIIPRIAADGIVRTHRSIVIVHLAAVILRTKVSCPIQGGLLRDTVPVLITVPAIRICRRTTLWSRTRTILCLIFRHISNEVSSPAGIEINT